ncbi:TetR/AcrR family transcriptional regulator [Bacillus salacetis]|uniref:TetR/AcrR family transcriptional regulator n=1 Tax=Bacillus salacetis TaxID=2315464 RepID=UPI003B9F77E3
MKEWIPIPGSNKDKLIQAALEAFSQNNFKDVKISTLAAKADMTTGAVYHHFGSKLKLYQVIRKEMEQRIVDRMEGAASLFEVPEESLKAALLTGLDFVEKQKAYKIFSEEPQSRDIDKVEDFIRGFRKEADIPFEILIISSWRSILKGLDKEELTLIQAKKLIKWMLERESL